MSPSQFRLIRIAGIGICCTLLVLRSLLLLKQHLWLHCMAHAVWLLPMASFIGALWLGTSSALNHRRRTLLMLLTAQSISVLGIGFTMGGQHATNYEGYLLLLVAVQIALTMPTAVAIPWILGQSSLLALSYLVADHSDPITAGISIVFKLFTYAIVVAIKRDADERSQVRELNAQMMATRETYAEHSRSRERLRISRDLHDVLGHRLTALALNLEIAIHKSTPDTGLPEIQQAQIVTRDLLQEVREVVSIMRPTAGIDLRSAMERIARGFAPIDVHLNFPADDVPCDPARGEVLVRCTQELITNAVKHGRARHVWIDLEFSKAQVLHLSCRDDGLIPPKPHAPKAEGTGLLSMRERFEQYGGNVHASTSSVGGFRIQGFLPMIAELA